MNDVNGRRTIQKENGGFTLIELLVVVAIIALLAGIIIPTVRGGLEKAKEVRAMQEMRDLEAAVRRFFAEYGYMPHLENELPVAKSDISLDASKEQGALILRLLGGNNGDINPKGIVFLDISISSFPGAKTMEDVKNKLAGDDDETACYPDPWGKAYKILLDMNMDDRIDLEGALIFSKVAIWSAGPTKRSYTRDTTPYKTW
jgi:prepilin-type N-terminal cleavage/methylation domain-containing protein